MIGFAPVSRMIRNTPLPGSAWGNPMPAVAYAPALANRPVDLNSLSSIASNVTNGGNNALIPPQGFASPSTFANPVGSPTDTSQNSDSLQNAGSQTKALALSLASMDAQTYRLSNGVTSYFAPMPGRLQSAITLTIPITPEMSGMSGLYGSLLLNGSDATRKRVNGLLNHDIHIAVDATPDKMIVSARSPKGRELEMLANVIDMLKNPQVSQQDFDRLQNTTQKALQELAKRPATPLNMVLSQSLYGKGSLYSLSPSDRSARLAKQSPESMVAHLQQTMQSSPLTLTMASPLSVEQQRNATEAAIKAVGWHHQPKNSGLQTVNTVHPPDIQGLPRSSIMLIPNDTLKRARVRFITEAPPPNDPDYPTYILLRYILSGNSKGSFFERLRTRDNLVYGVATSSGLPIGKQDSFQCGIEVGFDKIVTGTNELLAVTQEIASQPIDAKILDIAKRRYLLHMREMAQTPSDVLDSQENWLTHDLPPPSEARLQQTIQQLTPVDIQRVAQRMFNNANGIKRLGISAPQSALSQSFRGQTLTPYAES